MTNEDNGTITVVAMETRNLDTVCYRGTAPLEELTRVSKADTFDQVTNPAGLQRDLSKRHALDVYEYVDREADPKFPRAFPEVVVNARDKAVVDMTVLFELPTGERVMEITFDLAKIEKSKGIKVSRLDGNHRLMFGNGDGKDRPALAAPVPFQLHYGLTRDQERKLFLDINANQKALNTSHLAVQRSSLTAEQVELVQHPERVYARRLAEDEASPFYQKVYMGGSKEGAKKKELAFPVTFTTLAGAIKRMLNGSIALKQFDTADAVYAAIRGYWQAVAATWGEEFGSPDTLLMKNIGVNTLAQLAPSILDRLYTTTGEFGPLDMGELLAHTKDAVDWDKNNVTGSGAAGMSGNRAVLLVTGRLEKALPKLKKG